MGYHSILSGSIRIEPAIPEKNFVELLSTKSMPNHPVVIPAVFYRDFPRTGYVQEFEVFDDEDVDVKAYRLEEEIRTLLAVAWELGSETTGTIYCVGEEQGDIRRFVCEGKGHLSVQRAQVLWPDGSKVSRELLDL